MIEVTALTDTIQQLKDRERQADLAKLRGLRPIDDDFMRCIFRDNIPLAQLVLRIVTGIGDLEITRLETQKDMKRLVAARSICLDAYGCDSEGKTYDLEIQRADHGAGKKRARYHSSVMDIENLDAGQDFDELPDTYTIFITEHDVFGQGKALHPIERVDMASGGLFNDGEHILYVNGEYRDDSDIGKLMHDFSCWDPDEMSFDLMREATRYYKENPEGVEFMCKAFEETRNEGIAKGLAQGREEERVNSIKNLMDSMNLSAGQAMDALKVPLEEQPKYLAKL